MNYSVSSSEGQGGGHCTQVPTALVAETPKIGEVLQLEAYLQLTE
jgi:hypothetical protein